MGHGSGNISLRTANLFDPSGSVVINFNNRTMFASRSSHGCKIVGFLGILGMNPGQNSPKTLCSKTWFPPFSAFQRVFVLAFEGLACLIKKGPKKAHIVFNNQVVSPSHCLHWGVIVGWIKTSRTSRACTVFNIRNFVTFNPLQTTLAKQGLWCPPCFCSPFVHYKSLSTFCRKRSPRVCVCVCVCVCHSWLNCAFP
jgi:hypothetical protein